MTRHLLWTFVLVFCFYRSSSQTSRKEDIIYLKNGGVMRGKILERSDTLVRIESAGGNIYIFGKNEIESIGQDWAWALSDTRRPGIRSFTELGPLIAGRTTVDGVTTAAFSFQTAVVYAVTPHFMPGIGAGADLYATQTVLPLFGTVRGNLIKGGRFVPFYFLDLGYGINITQKAADGTDFRGGILYAAGAGIRIPFNKTSGFLLSAGYRYQHTAYATGQSTGSVDYRRLALRAGFYL